MPQCARRYDFPTLFPSDLEAGETLLSLCQRRWVEVLWQRRTDTQQAEHVSSVCLHPVLHPIEAMQCRNLRLERRGRQLGPRSEAASLKEWLPNVPEIRMQLQSHRRFCKLCIHSMPYKELVDAMAKICYVTEAAASVQAERPIPLSRSSSKRPTPGAT